MCARWIITDRETKSVPTTKICKFLHSGFTSWKFSMIKQCGPPGHTTHTKYQTHFHKLQQSWLGLFHRWNRKQFTIIPNYRLQQHWLGDKTFQHHHTKRKQNTHPIRHNQKFQPHLQQTNQTKNPTTQTTEITISNTRNSPTHPNTQQRNRIRHRRWKTQQMDTNT